MSDQAPIVLRSEVLEATLLPDLGARLHRLRAFGHDLIRSPDDQATHRIDPFFWGSYPMAPWCNRWPAGRRAVASRIVDLAANFPDGSAIHGLVAWRPWEVDGEGHFLMSWDEADSAWPWAFDVRLAASVSGSTLTLEFGLTNRSDAPMPAGLGIHPWFLRPLEVRVPAAAAYASNVGSSPSPVPVSGDHDLRTLAPPGIGLDGTWAALDEPVVELSWPRLGVHGRLTVSSSAGTLVAVANPEGIPAVAVEPQTHGPDPHRRLEAEEPDAPVLLPPAAELRLGVTLSLEE